MSYSATFIGHSANVAAALEEFSNTLSGPSRIEYDAAKPHFVELVKQNIGDKIVKIDVRGHGRVQDDVIVENQCQVTLQVFYGKLV